MNNKVKYYSLLALISLIGLSSSFSIVASADALSDEDQASAFTTVARMTTSYKNSPNSLTKLETKDLYLLGIDTFVDAMRLVPGMIVSDIHGSDVALGYHGSNVNVPRRIDILFNSNSLYRPGYAGLQWHRLPIGVDDLSHIEVVRGSSVTDYGSNAFTSTVNFVQRSVVLEPSLSLKYTAGSGDQRNLRAGHRYVWNKGHYFVRYLGRDNSGFDKTPSRDAYDDDSKGKSILLSGELQLTQNQVFDWTVAQNQSDYHVPDLTEVIAFNSATERALSSLRAGAASEEKNTIATFKLNGHSRLFDRPIEWHSAYNYTHFKRDQSFDLCTFQFAFDPDLEALDNSPNIHLSLSDLDATLAAGTLQLNDSIQGPLSFDNIQTLGRIGQKIALLGLPALASPICGITDQDVDETRQGAELQTTLAFSEQALLSTTLAYNHFKAESQTYLNGTATSNTLSLSNNLRYQWSNQWVSNFGLMFEDNSEIDQTLISSRASINYHIKPAKTLRFTWSRSKRSPDLYETARDWNYHVRFAPGSVDYNGQREATLFRNAFSPDNLDAEEITTAELAYTVADPLQEHILDIKVFDEQREQLISEPFEYLNFALTNEGQVSLQGFEAGYQYRSRYQPGLRAGFSYLYLDRDTETQEEKTLYSRHSGSVWAIFPVTEHSHLGLSYFGNTELATGNYSRLDATLSYDLPLASSDVQIQLNYRHYPNSIRSFTELSPVSPNVVSYDNQDRLFLRIKLEI